MTGQACLFWVNDSPPDGELVPSILVLYIPGPVLCQAAAVQAEALRNQARAMVDAEVLKKQPRGPLKERGGVTYTAGYAHTAASEKAREAIGTYGAAVTALLMVVWPYLVLLASVSAVGNPAILSVQAPWGFIPVGLDYFTHPHIDKDDATHTIVFLTLWKAASGRQCKDFTSPRERGQHVSRNIFTFGGISAFTRSSDCDLLVFDARRVVHGADLCVPLYAAEDAVGRPCGVTMGSGVVSRMTDVKAGRAVARGWLELAAQGRSAGRDAAKKLGMEFEQRIQENVSRGLGEVQSALEEQGGGSGRA